jgi:hypothetical protein
VPVRRPPRRRDPQPRVPVGRRRHAGPRGHGHGRRPRGGRGRLGARSARAAAGGRGGPRGCRADAGRGLRRGLSRVRARPLRHPGRSPRRPAVRAGLHSPTPSRPPGPPSRRRRRPGRPRPSASGVSAGSGRTPCSCSVSSGRHPSWPWTRCPPRASGAVARGGRRARPRRPRVPRPRPGAHGRPGPRRGVRLRGRPRGPRAGARRAREARPPRARGARQRPGVGAARHAVRLPAAVTARLVRVRAEHVQQLVALARHGRLPLAGSVSDVLPLSQAGEALERLATKQGDAVRLVLRP